MKLLKTSIAILIALIAMGQAGQAKQPSRFIDGFPDVPYLDIVTTLIGEPVIFDAPSGTVAEIGVVFSVPVESALKAYENALAGLGWVCSKPADHLRCIRDENMVQLTMPEPATTAPTLILRLEPKQ